MNKQLDSALVESEKMRVEADQANRKYNYLKRENKKLTQQTEDLSNQVRTEYFNYIYYINYRGHLQSDERRVILSHLLHK